MRFRELDGLRGIAAMVVVLSHFTGAYNSRFPNDPSASVDIWWGAYGVDLFFMISGFVVLLSAQRAKKPSDFVVSRFSRLYPPYWAALALSILLVVIFSIPGVHLSWTTILSNLTMVQRWFLQPNIDDVYWTLAVEMQFYVLLLVLLLITRCRITERVVVWTSMAWLVVSLAIAVIVSPYSHGVDPQLVDTPVKILLNVTLAEYGPLFAMGMLLFLSRQRGRIMPLAFVAAAVAVVNTGLIATWPKAGWIAAIIAGFFFVTQRRQTRILTLAPLQWVGKVSYSLYLTHSFVGFVVIRFTWPYIGRDGAILAAIAVSLLVAWGMYELTEKRLSRWLRNLLTGRRKLVSEPERS